MTQSICNNMRTLARGTSRHIDDTQTLIAVGVNRLREEHEAGKIEQMKAEHWRKQLRIMLGFGFTAFSIVCFLLGSESVPFVALFLHCIIHVVL